jgi:hypothetical protein
MPAELVMAGVVIALEGRLLQRAVHPLNLTVRPGVIGLGQAMLDAVLGDSQLEGVGPEELTAVDGLSDQGGG